MAFPLISLAYVAGLYQVGGTAAIAWAANRCEREGLPKNRIYWAAGWSSLAFILFCAVWLIEYHLSRSDL